MRTLAEQIVADDPSKLPEGETAVTQENYFRIVSKERLGTEQAVQFQSGDQYGAGWHWGSKLNETGEVIVSTDETNETAKNPSSSYYTFYARHASDGVWVENNSRAEMPRALVDNSESLFNWYAATAENGIWEDTGSDIDDSACPKGWTLPKMTNEQSWENLIATSYELTDGLGSAKILRTIPFNFTTTDNRGIYLFYAGHREYANSMYYWTREQRRENGRIWNFQLAKEALVTKGYNYKSAGLLIRCVKS